MRGLRTSLSGRILLAALATGVVAALVSAVISIVVINRVVDTQARTQLHARVAAIARLEPQRAATLSRIGLVGERYAIIEDGVATGRAARFATPAIIASVDSGNRVSTTLDLGRKGDAVIVEAVPRAGGGGVVGVRPVTDVRAGNAVFLRGLLLALAAGIVAAVVAGLAAGRRIGRPLAGLATDARRLAQGERGLEVTPQRVPEIEDIALALHALDSALHTSESRQREFLLSISHELRTPLTALRGYAEALADGVVAPEDVADVGATLVAESDRLGRFTADLLELARLEADDFRIVPAPMRLDEVVLGAGAAWWAAADRVGVELSAEAPPLTVMVDGQRLRQLLDGLIENALRVTPSGGGVRVTGFSEPSVWGVEVEDDGPGLRDADFDVAFDRGVLHERYREERAVGSGLGLSIARRLVGRLGGAIAVSHSATGGALFRVELPQTPLHDPDLGAPQG